MTTAKEANELALQNEINKASEQIDSQNNAIELILNDLKDKEVEVNGLSEKRMDIQLEARSKSVYLEDLDYQIKLLKANNKQIIEVHLEKNRLKQAQIEKREMQKKEGGLDEESEETEEKLEILYEKIEMDALKLVQGKIPEIQAKCRETFNGEVQKKLDSIKEKSNEILKRLESYQKENKGESHSSQGKAFNNTILVKVFVESLHPNNDSDDEDDLHEIDDIMSNKSKVSHKSAISAKTGKSTKSRKMKERDEKEQMKREEEDNRTSHDKIFRFYQETFRISKVTVINEFKETMCDYWGLPKEHFFFYDDNGEKIEELNSGDSVQFKQTVERVMEQVMAKDLRDKEILPPGRKNMLYIGDKGFEDKYHKLMDLKRKEEEKKRDEQKFKRNLQDINDEFETMKEEDMLPDKEEIFLRQFPGLSGHYSNNKELFRKYKNKNGFDIKYGNWIPPTCCSMLVNIIQFILTWASIQLYKGQISAYWLPELIRGDLTSKFYDVRTLNHFWDFTENTLGNFIFQNNTLIDKDSKYGDVNKTLINTFQMAPTFATQSKGRLFVGPVRFIQKRVSKKICKQKSNIQIYERFFEKCYPMRYNELDEQTETIGEFIKPDQDTSWGNYYKQKVVKYRLTQNSEYYEGHLGNYYPYDGYKQDFYPYDTTFDEYLKIIKEMKNSKTGDYVEFGPTKMINIDLTLVFPATQFFVSVNMMFEFTQLGQVIPTRIDIMPYTLSGFSEYGDASSHKIDMIKMFLVVYTCYAVFVNCQSYKTIENVLKLKNIWANIVDIMIIILQSWSFIIKVQDGNWFQFNPMTVLRKTDRYNYQSTFFLARNFRNFCMMETIGLIFVLFKVVSGLRYIQRLNVIIMCVLNSVGNMSLFLIIMILFNVIMTPLAQAIWGTQLIGYKTFSDALTSVFMIAYSKGNLEKILNINVYWAFLFILIYYVVILFLLHAAMHHIQTASLKNVVLLNSLKENDLLPDEDDENKKLSRTEFAQKVKAQNVGQVIRGLEWFFGWLPRDKTAKFEQLNEIMGVRVQRKRQGVNFESSDDEIEMSDQQIKSNRKK